MFWFQLDISITQQPLDCNGPALTLLPSKGTTINDLGGAAEEIQKKKSEEKKLERLKIVSVASKGKKIN